MKDRARTAFWVLLVSGLCTFALAMGYRWFERGGAFDLDTVRIQGIRNADSAVVCQVVRPLFGTSIWNIDIEALQNSLTMIPGIDSARVRRAPLRTIILELKVSAPSFVLRNETGMVAFSHTGEPLPERFLSDSLPHVDARAPLGEVTARNLAHWFCSDSRGPDSLGYCIDAEGLSVETALGQRILLGTEDLPVRWRAYVALETSSIELEPYSEIDMRYSGQAVLRSSSSNLVREDTQ